MIPADVFLVGKMYVSFSCNGSLQENLEQPVRTGGEGPGWRCNTPSSAGDSAVITATPYYALMLFVYFQIRN